MTVVIRQEAKFSFMPEILAADIVVGACEGKKLFLGWVVWETQRPPVVAFFF